MEMRKIKLVFVMVCGVVGSLSYGGAGDPESRLARPVEMLLVKFRGGPDLIDRSSLISIGMAYAQLDNLIKALLRFPPDANLRVFLNRRRFIDLSENPAGRLTADDINSVDAAKILNVYDVRIRGG
jgi:hypothetical protein